MTRHIYYIVFVLLLHLVGQPATAQNTRIIKADTRKVLGATNNMFRECIGAGRANEGLRADWQQQLATVQKEIGFNYIRFHGLLHDDMAVYSFDKQGKLLYNYQYIDKLFDYLLSIRIRPFVEFSFMPAALASGTKTIFWWKGNVTKPKSYPGWDSLITNVVTHWTERYGQEEVARWYFEVWNEPDLRGFFDGTQADYFELYAHTAKAVKSVSSKYRVGGPATSATKWIPEFLHHCDSIKAPVDFVSTHDYGTTSVLDTNGTKKQQLKSNYDTIANNVKKVRDIIDASAFKNAELHFTEWNTSPSSRDPMHDSYQNATYILNTLKKTGRSANSMSYWTFTDIFEEAGPGPTIFHGGFGLLNQQGIRKPSYYAYKFLSELGEKELVNTDPSSYVCASADGGMQVLLWDCRSNQTGKAFNQVYFIEPKPSADLSPVSLELTGVKNGRYTLQIYTVGYKTNDPFTRYLEMGRPAVATRQQETELAALSTGSSAGTETITVSNGTVKRQIPLRENDIVLIKLLPLAK